MSSDPTEAIERAVTVALSGTTGAGVDVPALEGYRDVVEIARGGMGVVLRATDIGVGRPVAIKVLPLPDPDPDSRDRFLFEARVLGSLEHPAIVPIHEIGRTEDGRDYFSMKLVQGRTLAEVLAQGGTPLPELLAQFAKVCEAIDFAHSRGILHRDLKPANVMVGPFGEVLVMDWGLARVAGPDGGTAAAPGVLPGEHASRTLAGTVLGTPSYMSPEQAAGDLERIDSRSDVYGLGALLYEILTGSPPFSGSTVQEILELVAAGRIVPPGRRAPDRGIPPDLEAIALKAMAHDPARRYAGAAGVRAEVLAYLAGEPITARRIGRIERTMRRVRRHPVVSALAAALVLAIAGGMSGIAVAWRSAVGERNAKTAEMERSQDRLARALFEEARGTRRSDLPGRRGLAIDRLGQAVALAARPRAYPAEAGVLPDPESLRTEAVEALRLDDLEPLWDRPFQDGLVACSTGDGTRLAVWASSPGTDRSELVVLDVRSGVEIARKAGIAGPPSSIAIDDGGSRVALARGGRLLVLDLPALDVVLDEEVADRSGQKIAFGPDRDSLVGLSFARSGGGRVELRHLGAEAPQTVLAAVEGSTILCRAPGGRRIAFVPDPARIVVFDLGELRPVDEFGPQGTVESVLGCEPMTFSPDGTSLLWLARTGGTPPSRRLCRRVLGVSASSVDVDLPGPGSASLAIGPGSTTVVLAPGSPRIAVLGPWGGRPILEVPSGHVWPVRLVGASADGTIVFTSGRDGLVRAWRPQIGRVESRVSFPGRTLERIAFSPDGRRLAFVSAGEGPSLVDRGTGAIERQFQAAGVTELLFRPDSLELLAHEGRRLVAWDLATGTDREVGEGHCLPRPAYRPDGTIRFLRRQEDGVVVGLADGDAVRWGPFRPEQQVQMDPGGDWILTYPGAGRIELHGLGGEGQTLALETAASDPVQLVWTSRIDRGWILGYREPRDGGPPELTLWTVPAVRVAWRRRIRSRPDWVVASPDARSLALAHPDGWIEIRSVESGEVTCRWAIHAPPAAALGFTPDSKSVAWIERESDTIRMFDLEAVERGLDALGLGAASR